jgi:hypothetical protein
MSRKELNFFASVLDLKYKRHTAENIQKALEETLPSLMVDFKKIKSIVTDSPSTMLKFRRELSAKYPHIVGLPCALHVWNLIVKDVTSLAVAQMVISRNRTLVNYFTTTGVWNEVLKLWCQKNEVSHWLSNYVETRWYSLAKLCLSIQSCEDGLRDCKRKASLKHDNLPPLPE